MILLSCLCEPDPLAAVGSHDPQPPDLCSYNTDLLFQSVIVTKYIVTDWRRQYSPAEAYPIMRLSVVMKVRSSQTSPEAGR